MAALRPRTDGLDPRWRSVLAKEASLMSERGGAGECVSPAGHRYLCIHCGSDMPTAGSASHWAWPAAAGAMASTAAILLMMLVTGHGLPRSAVAPARSVGAEAIKADAKAPSRMAYDSAGTTVRAWRGDDQGILTAADTALPNSFFSPSGFVGSAKGAAAGDMERTDAQSRNSELLWRLLREQRIDGGSNDHSRHPAFQPPENKS